MSNSVVKDLTPEEFTSIGPLDIGFYEVSFLADDMTTTISILTYFASMFVDLDKVPTHIERDEKEEDPEFSPYLILESPAPVTLKLREHEASDLYLIEVAPA